MPRWGSTPVSRRAIMHLVEAKGPLQPQGGEVKAISS